MKGKIDLQLEQRRLKIAVTGDITADAEFPKVPRQVADEIIFDLGSLGYMNSGGIRNWICWVSDVNKDFKDARITFVNLPAISVRQASQVAGFLPTGANIESFIIPYFCEHCDKNTAIVFTRGKNWDSAWNADKKIDQISSSQCPSCGKTSEIDADPAHYVSF